MFESIAPDVTVVRQGRGLFYKVLPASLVVHAIAILALPIGASWQVVFPTQSPRMFAPYNLVEPPPPPPPPPPAPPKPVQAVKLPDPIVPREIVAPTVIPDEIPAVTEPVATPVENVVEGVEGGVEGGVEDGVVGGTPEGVVGGVITGTPGGVKWSVDHGRVVVPRDEELDLYPVSKDYPFYPESAQRQRWEDRLVVRYVIGKNGRVKEVTVIEAAQRKMFDDAAVDAIRTWRFRPMIRDGKKVEVVHELTVYFKLRKQ